jgi:hypothetical protein
MVLTKLFRVTNDSLNADTGSAGQKREHGSPNE